jgi:hypothetical protein
VRAIDITKVNSLELGSAFLPLCHHLCQKSNTCVRAVDITEVNALKLGSAFLPLCHHLCQKSNTCVRAFENTNLLDLVKQQLTEGCA